MLAMARAFVNDSKLLLIDEPSKGLAPIVIEKVMEAITEMKKSTTIVSCRAKLHDGESNRRYIYTHR